MLLFIIDGSIAAQNMILAAHALGVGSVWLGTYPQMERVEAQRKLFELPGMEKGVFEPDRVHVDKWQSESGENMV